MGIVNIYFDYFHIITSVHEYTETKEMTSYEKIQKTNLLRRVSLKLFSF